MFSIYHIIWIILSVVIIVVSTLCIKKYKPSFNKMVDICFWLGIVSEIIKVISVTELVPIENKLGLYPYLELRYLPLHLCSLQLIVFAYFKIAKEPSEFKYWIISFMYPSCVVGGILGVIIPSIFNTSISVNQAFAHPLAYQTFLYHTMLVVFGIYLFMNKEIELKADGYKKCLTIVFALSVLAVYGNSMLSIPVYENGKLVAMHATTNFFFTSLTPIGINFAYKWHWALYLIILTILVFVLVGLLYLPMYLKRKQS